MTHILHFTITPVQSFIGQSRRTRDLWSSSFLLSWLTGVAMAEIIRTQAGTIVFPEVQDGQFQITDDLLRGILKKSNGAPFIGTLPNRFKARVNATFDPRLCVDAVQAKWQELASAVKASFLPLAGLHGKPFYFVPRKKQKNPNAQEKGLTETLWEQQTASFWDIHWVMGEDLTTGSDGSWLDLRKNWRQHIQPDQQEPGDACTLMPGWVELSGHIRTRHKKHQDDFWCAIREHIPTVPHAGKLNLREDERLCAIAFIKRMWPKLPQTKIREVFGWVPGRVTQSGGNWPSTACMAALPWVQSVYAKELEAERDGGSNGCQHYAARLAESLNTEQPEESKEGLFSEKKNQIAGFDDEEYFCTLDGRLFYEEGLPAAVKDKFVRTASLPTLQRALFTLHQRYGRPSSFYAVLRMDGDRVGELIGSSAHEVSLALKTFADHVQDIVDKQPHCGATLYAGGDDVLALLSLDQALPCALALQAAYTTAMQSQGLAGTVSAAIVFAHYHLPLSFVMAESDKLLNEVAKDGNDRNSLAVSVHKPGGEHLQWVSHWDAANAPDPEAEPIATLVHLVDRPHNQQLPLSSGFLYRIRERWSELTDDHQDLAPEFTPDYVQKLWAVDLLANRDLGKVTPEAREQAATLARQLFTISRDQKNLSPDSPPSPTIRLSEDGALLVRFLDTKGVHV